MIVAYADAALKDNLLGMGYHLLRGTNGSELLEASSRVLNVGSVDDAEWHSLEAEYRAIITAVRRATEYGTDSLVVFNDNRGVVAKVRNGVPIRDGYFQHALFSFLGRFSEWRISWVPRDHNTVAHAQATEALEMAEYLCDSIGMDTETEMVPVAGGD